ncbi:next to BRCA1 gene 1 protein isoform X4 [Monodelphis domestica]|nr:next to BRCA1 gene 1 protein isoform X4 [Monodelphis domestica]XP_056672646.1 next to BRCA1 gene 1 protein isoform X4 [Monodelphis domestica]XP_056672647.1 next to BRCA1 gene 1 protein isoform X4 [Monodelphis domestica]
MEPQVNLNVTFKNETQSFLVSDSENTTWADVEAMVKVSYDLNTIQIKYLDEDSEEVSINSQGEYEEALKIAVKQGNQLQMNVYDRHNVVDETPQPGHKELPGTEKRPAVRTGKKPLTHYSSLVRALGSEMKTQEESTAQLPLTPCEADKPQDKPPDWFTRYLEMFREQVVKETVEKLDQKLSEKLVLQSPSLESCSSIPVSEEALSLPGNQCDWLMTCSNCQRRIIGIRYQCSLCPSYNICELCEAGSYAHDPNHILLKLRRPIMGSSETYTQTKLSPPRLPAALEQVRLQKQMDKNFLKAEKQRLRAEKKQRKAEVKELKKQLKLHRKIHLWNSIHGLQSPKSPLGRPESLLHSSTLMLPMQPCAPVVPTLSAAFVDENVPDGTHLQPGTKFIKHWRMKNTGNVKWSAETKLKFMWGNLTLASTERKDVLVPYLKAGHVGIVSVEFIAPALEGTYTSHWRLSHKGEQFGPRVWCSIIVDPFPTREHLEDGEKVSFSTNKVDDLSCQQEEAFSLTKEKIQIDEVTESTEGTEPCIPLKIKSVPSERELYIPSVDLLTAQDLLSFELLDINIVQELERVPHNTPVDMTPCMSPLPHDSPLIEKPGLGQIEEESEGTGFKVLPDTTVASKNKAENTVPAEEGEEDLSGTQFVCETVIRSLTLDAAPDHNPPRRLKSLQNSLHMLSDNFSYGVRNEETLRTQFSPSSEGESQPQLTEERQPAQLDGFSKEKTSLNSILPEERLMNDEKRDTVQVVEEEEEEEEEELKDEVRSQGSSASSEDYIIILPECFDTSRPLGESMYSSALSQPGLERLTELEQVVKAEQEPAEAYERLARGENQQQGHLINDILTTSQTLDAVLLTPEVVGPPRQMPSSPSSLQNISSEESDLPITIQEFSPVPDQVRGEPRASSGLVNSRQKSYENSRYYQGSSITGGLVKGAMSFAASAYKALFAGPPVTAQVSVYVIFFNCAQVTSGCNDICPDSIVKSHKGFKKRCSEIVLYPDLLWIADQISFATFPSQSNFFSSFLPHNHYLERISPKLLFFPPL